MSSESYEWTAEMGEVSGLGGEYEEACRDMVVAGVEWLDEHPDADLQASVIDGVIGVVEPDTAETEALMDHMSEELTNDGRDAPTGAMMHTCVGHVMYVAGQGWDAYAERMEADDRAE